MFTLLRSIFFAVFEILALLLKSPFLLHALPKNQPPASTFERDHAIQGWRCKSDGIFHFVPRGNHSTQRVILSTTRAFLNPLVFSRSPKHTDVFDASLCYCLFLRISSPSYHLVNEKFVYQTRQYRQICHLLSQVWTLAALSSFRLFALKFAFRRCISCGFS